MGAENTGQDSTFAHDTVLAHVAQGQPLLRFANDLLLAGRVVRELAHRLFTEGLIDQKGAEGIRAALSEVVINAIEHGNLEIDYDEKTRRIHRIEEYTRFLAERSQEEKYRERMVEIEDRSDDETIRFVVRDQGPGFDHSSLPDPTDPEHQLIRHGRGILLARVYMDEVTYNPQGNEVTLVKRR